MQDSQSGYEERIFFEDDTDFEKMPPPKPGEWLYAFKEKGQTFAQYKTQIRNRKTSLRDKIYIQPVGTLNQTYKTIIEKMKDYATAFFGIKTVVNQPVPYFASAYNSSRGQYNASLILNRLAGKIPEDALAFVGITDRDLYVEGLNFVFGIGSDYARGGVYSLIRLEDEDFNLFLRRSLKLMSHEIGHILSIAHCIKYRCVMNGSNSLPEADMRPMFSCPVDLQKICYNLGLSPYERYLRLQEFFRQNGFDKEVRWISKRLSRLKGV
jgi:archaemetzincin